MPSLRKTTANKRKRSHAATLNGLDASDSVRYKRETSESRKRGVKHRALQLDIWQGFSAETVSRAMNRWMSHKLEDVEEVHERSRGRDCFGMECYDSIEVLRCPRSGISFDVFSISYDRSDHDGSTMMW